MPYHQTRSEIAARIAMRAVHDAAPTRTQRQIATLFQASLRTVNQALKRTMDEWARDLAAAPPTRKASRVIHHRSQPVTKRVPYLANPPMPKEWSVVTGTRKKFKPVAQEHEEGIGEDLDAPPGAWKEQSDEGMPDR